MSTAPANGSTRLVGLAPVVDAQVRCLILGSFPSPASLAAQQYYGHKQNQFWRLLGATLAEPLLALPYPERLVRMCAHGIGLWDVYQSCIRPGALDANIRAGTANDFAALIPCLPQLARLCFNGQTAARFASRFAVFGLATVTLPSSSPACTWPFAEKLKHWQAGIGQPAGNPV
ncbi:MAG: DNA-deoxyinosine glycosylase [Zoogloeaceae bacterium]|jgi:hypoxanthine-DNA glycosylase|nr:DNA-deoxyinosine glycosylase [Zoogloeaceae bacterium]